MNLLKIAYSKIMNSQLLISYLVIFVVIVFGALTYTGSFMDDAYITFRFSHNIADGYWFQWNRGEMPIEGFSNPLWTLIIALFHFTYTTNNIDFIVYYFSLSLFLIIAFHIQYIATSILKINPVFSSVIIIIMLCSNAVWLSYFNGLETIMQAFLLYFSFYILIFKYEKCNMFMFILFLLMLNRFEGIAYALGLSIIYIILNIFDKRDRLINIKTYIPLIVTIVFFLVYEIIRYSIFGYFTPLSVAAKSSGHASTINNLLSTFYNESGWKYIKNFLLQPQLLFASGILILGLFLKQKSIIRSFYISLALLFLGASSIVIYNGGDWMPGFRLLSPFIPIILLLLLTVLSLLNNVFSFNLLSKYVLLVSIVTLAYFGVFSTGNLSSFKVVRHWGEHRQKIGAYWDKILNDNEAYAVMMAGWIPYGGKNLNTIDYNGLVFPCIGRGDNPSSIWGKNWDLNCIFKHETKIFDTQFLKHAKKIYNYATKHNIQLEVVVGGNEGLVSNNQQITFIRKSFISKYKMRDKTAYIVPFEKYQQNVKYYRDVFMKKNK